MRIWTAALLLSGLATAWTPANAADSQPFLHLTTQYEAAVEDFERIVLRVRGIDRNDEKLVDRLDDAVARMRLAAKNPRHFNRLYYRWREVQKLHAEVESRIFSKYTPHHDLLYGWRVVNYHYSLIGEELFYAVENPGHANSVQKADNNSRRESYLSPSLGEANIELDLQSRLLQPSLPANLSVDRR